MKQLGIVILLITIAMPAFPQQGKTGYSGFSFISPAEISVGRDDNFLVERATTSEQLLVLSLPAGIVSGAPNIFPTPLSDTVYLLKPPTVGYLANNKRREFNVVYQPEIEIFQANPNQNSWNTLAEVSYTQLLRRRWMAYIGDAYRTSKDPSRTLSNPLLLLPRSQYRENAFRAAISFQPSERTDFTLRYDNSAMSFGERDPLQRNILDSLSSGIALMYSRMLTRTQRLRVTYAVFDTQPWTHNNSQVTQQFLAFKTPAQSLTGEYRISLNPKTVLEVSGGAIRTTLGTDGIFSVMADRRVGEFWIGGGYSRGITFFGSGQSVLPSGVSSNSFYDVVNFRMRGQPTRKIGVQVNVNASRNAYGTLVNANETVMGRSRIDYRLGPHVVAFFNAELYQQNQNAYVQTPMSRHRLFIGFDYSFASDAEQRTSKLNRDADNVALTEHGRLRKPDQE